MNKTNNISAVIRETPAHVLTLYDMLTYKRPDNSQSEEDFIKAFIHPLDVTEDAFGNLWKVVGDEPPTILWSSHTDSVHAEGGRQKLELSEDGWMFVGDDSNCLGADCAAGVWIMVNMIERKVPGLYVFHRAEESGGRGSQWFAKHTLDKAAPEGIKAAIAFDRRAFTSIITRQWGGRCCSDAFAASLARELDPHPETCLWKLDPTGSFTDTANYTHIIPECTNISVGYMSEHSKDERLFVPHLETLLEDICAIDQSALVIEREPVEEDDNVIGFTPYSRNRYYTPPSRSNDKDREELIEAMLDHPDIAAAILADNGFSADDILWEAYKAAPIEDDKVEDGEIVGETMDDEEWRQRLAAKLREEDVDVH